MTAGTPSPPNPAPRDAAAKESKPTAPGDLVRLALELGRRLDRIQSALVVIVIVVGLAAVQLTVAQGSVPYLGIVAGVALVVAGALIALHRIDTRVSTSGALSETDMAAMVAAMTTTRDQVADNLGCAKDQCRANIFGMNPLGRLQIMKLVWVNMANVAEWAVSMPPGRGCTGIAWVKREPKAIVRPFDGDEDLESADAARVDPRLQWIISVPVPRTAGGAPIWILNVDGMQARPRHKVEGAINVALGCVVPLQAFADRVPTSA